VLVVDESRQQTRHALELDRFERMRDPRHACCRTSTSLAARRPQASC
jgi:hypothetical protein